MRREPHILALPKGIASERDRTERGSRGERNWVAGGYPAHVAILGNVR